MTRRMLRLFFIFIAFTIEVKVHALELTQSCGVAVRCYFFSESLEIQDIEGSEYRTQSGTAVKSLAKNQVVIVNGKLLVNTLNTVLVRSIYGDVLVDKGEALILINDKELSLISLSGAVFYRGNGFENSTKLNPGLSVNIGRVRSHGKAEVGYPDLVEKNKLVKTWSSFYKKDEAREFLNKLTRLARQSAMLADDVALTYKVSIQREQASLDQRRENARLRKLRVLKETEYLRDLFREKNYLNYLED